VPKAARDADRWHRRSLRPLPEAPTIANSLKPDGMVYDLVQNRHIPVDRAINPGKAVFGADFTTGGKSYPGGSFIIEAPCAAVRATVAGWQARGVAVNKHCSGTPPYNCNPGDVTDVLHTLRLGT
jgi:hypothetical protein